MHRAASISLTLAFVCTGLLFTGDARGDDRILGVWKGKPRISDASFDKEFKDAPEEVRNKMKAELKSAVMTIEIKKDGAISGGMTIDGKERGKQFKNSTWKVLKSEGDNVTVQFTEKREGRDDKVEKVVFRFSGPNKFKVTPPDAPGDMYFEFERVK